MNIDAYHEAAEHFLGALVVQGVGPDGAGGPAVNDNDPLWSTLQRTFVLMVGLSKLIGIKSSETTIFDRTEATWQRSLGDGEMLRIFDLGDLAFE